jgi:hypothetical protein
MRKNTKKISQPCLELPMKSVIDHLDIASAIARQMINYLANISSTPRDLAAFTRTEAELLRALAKYCSEEADHRESVLPRLLRLQRLKQQQQEPEQQEPEQQEPEQQEPEQQELHQQQQEPEQQEQEQEQQNKSGGGNDTTDHG